MEEDNVSSDQRTRWEIDGEARLGFAKGYEELTVLLLRRSFFLGFLNSCFPILYSSAKEPKPSNEGTAGKKETHVKVEGASATPPPHLHLRLPNVK